jgi:hypothetical protein
MVGPNNALIFVDCKKYGFAALIARRCRDGPRMAEELAKEPFFNRTGRSRDRS